MRLRKLSKRRRRRELLKQREQERLRQQVCRDRRRELGVVTTSGPPLGGTASRSTLSPEAIVSMEVILENWDKSIGRSRAGLRSDIRIVLREIIKNVGQVGTEKSSRHAPTPND